MMIDSLVHVCITVADIDAALDFYCGVLGLESVGKLRNERAPGALLGLPDAEIEIHAEHLLGKCQDHAAVLDLIEIVAPQRAAADAPFAPLVHAGVNSMAFDVADAGEIYDRLRARGDIVILSGPQLLVSPAGVRCKVLRFEDPFGNLLQVVEQIN